MVKLYGFLVEDTLESEENKTKRIDGEKPPR